MSRSRSHIGNSDHQIDLFAEDNTRNHQPWRKAGIT